MRPISKIILTAKDARLVEEGADGNAAKEKAPKEYSISKGPFTMEFAIDKYGLVEDPIMDPDLIERIQQELAAAAKGRDYLDRKKEEDFEKIRQQKIAEWKESRRTYQASFEDHPDVQMMSVLSGADGILMAPQVAREYDGKLVDQGWYPYVRPDDVKNTKYDRSKRERYTPKVEKPEGIPADVKVPSFDSIRDYYLEQKGR